MSDIDLDAIEARANACVSHYGHSVLPTDMILALIARVREQELEIQALRAQLLYVAASYAMRGAL